MNMKFLMSELEVKLMDLILGKPFKFWCCSNSDHKFVSWNNNSTQATCDGCGETSTTFDKSV
jgi:hypothetical protein